MTDEGKRYVWVVENGCYSGRYIEGVYDSIEAVIAAHPVKPPERVRHPGFQSGASYLYREGGWQGNDEEGWSNGLDWNDHLRAERYEVLTRQWAPFDPSLCSCRPGDGRCAKGFCEDQRSPSR